MKYRTLYTQEWEICMEIVAFVVLGPRSFSPEEWLIGSNLVDPFWLWTAGRSWKPFIQGWKLIAVIGKRQHLTNFAGRLFRHAIWASSKPPLWVIGQIHSSQFVRRIFADFSPLEIMKLPPLQKNHEIQYLHPHLCTYSSQTFAPHFGCFPTRTWPSLGDTWFQAQLPTVASTWGPSHGALSGIRSSFSPQMRSTLLIQHPQK